MSRDCGSDNQIVIMGYAICCQICI